MKAAGKEALAIRMYWDQYGGQDGRWYVDLVCHRRRDGKDIIAEYTANTPLWFKRMPRTPVSTGFAGAMISEALKSYKMTAPEDMIAKAARDRFGGLPAAG